MSDCKYECPVCAAKLFVFSDGNGDWLEQFDEAQPNKLTTALARAERAERLCGEAHSVIDKLMGDSDLDSDDSPEMTLMQKLAPFAGDKETKL